MNDVTAREMKGIQQRQNDLGNSHQGMRSELEVAVGNLGALITRVDKISLEEFVKHIPVSQVVGPTLDLLHQQVVEAVSTHDSKVQLTLEEFSKALNGSHSSVEECLNQLRSSLIEELSQVFGDPVSDSISSFPNVSAILSRLSKVETEVDTWKEWSPNEENLRDEVPKVSHPSSSAYHDPPIRSKDHNCDPTGGGHNSSPRDLPSQFQNPQFLRVHPVFEAMASGNTELFTRDPIRDIPVDKIFLDCWSFAAFALHSMEAMRKQQRLQDYVKEHPAAAPLLNEKDLQNPGPKDLLWSSISRDWDLLDGDTKKDIRDKLKRPTWKMEDQGQPPTWPAFKRAWDVFAGYWVPLVPDSIMVYTLLSALPDQKKEMYGALHTYLKWDYTHIWDDLMVRGRDQEDRGDLGDKWESTRPPKTKTVDGHTQWVIMWCVNGQRARPITAERAREAFVRSLLTHGGYEAEMDEVYRIERQTGHKLDWLMVHRVVLWEMIWREQAFKEKARARTQAQRNSAIPTPANRVCTECGSSDPNHDSLQCRAGSAQAGKGGAKGSGGGWGQPKGKLPAGCEAWSELKRKAFDALVSSLADRINSGNCGWCGSSEHRAQQCPTQHRTSAPGKPKPKPKPKPWADRETPGKPAPQPNPKPAPQNDPKNGG